MNQNNINTEYYVQSDLVIEYKDINRLFCKIYTDRNVKKKYIYEYDDYSSEDDYKTSQMKLNNKIERKLRKYTFNKILYEKNEWVKKSYKKKYEKYIAKEYKEIVNMLKVYKKVTAYK